MKLLIVVFTLVAGLIAQAETLDLAPKKSATPVPVGEVAIPNFEKVQKTEDSKIPTECQAIRNGVCVRHPNGLKDIHPHGEHRPNGNLKLGE